MMRRISEYFISILVIIFSSLLHINGQDTITFPLKINVGIEVIGPVNYLVEKNTFSAEGYISADLNEKLSAVLAGGYLNYDYSQYNYTYLNKGIFFRVGADFNLLKPKKSLGKYWGGIGLRYGLSRYTSEVPSFSQNNYWGEAVSLIPAKTSWGHFIEASPGMRAEIFRNFSMGWAISLRMLIYSGGSKDLRPIYFPGFGNATKRFSSGFSYFIVWNIPYKKIRVIIEKEEPEEADETEDTEGIRNSEDTRTPANRQQSPGNDFR